MSNTALSSARRRRAIPPPAPISQQQQQRMMEMQRQQQPQPQQLQPPQNMGGIAGIGPYTQRPISAPPAPPHQQRPLIQQLQQPQPQFIKPGSAIPPGYIQTIHANGLPQIECVETGTVNFPYGEAPLPPIIILRNHDKQLIQLEGQNNDFANQLAHITSRISSLQGQGQSQGQSQGQGQDNKQPQQPQQAQDQTSDASEYDTEPQGQGQAEFSDDFISDLTSNREFILNVVENIMKNTNLSDLVNEIEPIKAENRELKSLVLSQQEMMNGMNALLFNLLNRVHSNNDGDNNSNEDRDYSDNDNDDSPIGYEKIVISDSVLESEPAITLAISDAVDVETVSQPECAATEESAALPVQQTNADNSSVAADSATISSPSQEACSNDVPPGGVGVVGVVGVE